MSVSREELTRRAHATRRWLEKAEESFRNRSTVKGELNLLLAQAEWQKLREQRSADRRLSYWQQGAALAVALLTVLWLVGMWPTGPMPADDSDASAVPVVREVPTSLVLPQEPGLKFTPTAAPAATAAPVAVTSEAYVPAEPETVVLPAPAQPLSQAELNSVVSDAGKVLRGQA